MEDAYKICGKLQKKYFKCLEKTKKKAFEGDLTNNCDEPFEDYKTCVNEVMLRKVRKAREQEH